ncbi:hypothetical protein ACOB87_18135 [Streptomyces sp. YS-B37]|uniref:hypothetical protein n=1 Tax=Streptomyces sp. YS-B37 TaxID=3407669 RepID=UPI003B5051F1
MLLGEETVPVPRDCADGFRADVLAPPARLPRPRPAKPQHTPATGRQPERHADLLALDALGVGNRLLSHPYVNSRNSRPSRE